MAKPSLKASVRGLEAAKQALMVAGTTQKDLTELVGCSRQPVTNFFQGKTISQDIFISICDRLNLDWQEVAGLTAPKVVNSIDSNGDLTQNTARNDLDLLVSKLRKKVSIAIKEQCGTMRILDMSYPIEVNDIYTNVNILEKITANRYKTIDLLLQESESTAIDRFSLGKVTEASIPGVKAVERYQKLIILGKPGAGKTTFLKYLAIQCHEGHFEAERVPIFVNLKNFAEAENKPDLLRYISQKIANYAFPIATQDDLEKYVKDFSSLFYYGKALVLLDGLDEVRAEDSDRIIKEIRDFSQQFLDNHFVMTCRIAAWEYNFEKFTEVEIADFDEQQVASFAEKWFQRKPIKASTFLKHLRENPRILLLTVSPLLLTLVCLAFEETGDCPQSRSELYKEGIDALLKKWDASRGIQRDRVYKQLSLQRKEDLLSKLALDTFKQKDYFFKQFFIEQFIAEYIRKLPRANSDPEELQLDSAVVLKSIEAQHGLLIERAKGIYSFSHLTFHEYFTASELVFNSSSLDEAITELMNHISDRGWREVFLLTTEMLRDASVLLLPMKEYIDGLVASSSNLQQFLTSVKERAQQLEFSGIQPAAIKAFYFDVNFDFDENRTAALQIDSSANYLVSASFLHRILDGVSLEGAIAISQAYDSDLEENCTASQKDKSAYLVSTSFLRTIFERKILDGVSLEEAIAISQQYPRSISKPREKIIEAKSANEVMIIAISIALCLPNLPDEERKELAILMQKLAKTPADEVIKEIADKARTRAKSRHSIPIRDNEAKKLRKEYYYVIQLLVECLYSEGCMLAPQLRKEINDSLFV